MNRQQFKETLEKLELRKPCTVEVLRRILAGDTDAQIALSRGRNEGTVRKQISKIYQDFGIKGKFPGDRQSRRNELIALFAKYKTEWVNDCPPAVTNEVSDEGKKINQNSVSLSNSPNTEASEGGEYLMSLATSMLEQLGFNHHFNINRTSQYIGYKPKNLKIFNKGYKFILILHKRALSICILKNILEPYLLKFNFMCNDEDGSDCILVGEKLFWLIPSKEDIFFDINTQYDYGLNSWNYGESLEEYYLHPFRKEIISQEEFESDEFEEFQNKSFTFYNHDPYFEALINSKCCLDICKNGTFSYVWEIFINSSKVLQEFITYLEEMLI